MARSMTNVLQIVHSVFSTAVKAAYPGFSPAKGMVQSSGSGGKFGDYKCMAAMPIAQVKGDSIVRSVISIIIILSKWHPYH